jgi:hypothetical protein
MPVRPVTDVDQQAVARLHAEGHSRNHIARQLGRSPATISTIANQLGLTFDRTATKNATLAKIQDNKALRVATSRRLLDKANAFLDQMDDPHLAFNFGGKDNTYNEHQLPKPPVADLRNLMISVGVAIDKHLALDRHDADPGVDGAKTMLGALAAGLGEAYKQLTTDDDQP